MPNPVRPVSAKMYHRLTSRQRAIVRNVRAKGLKVVAYRRKGSRSKLSVHNPPSDTQRYARLAPTEKAARRYPQAYDTWKQRAEFKGTPKYIRKNLAKTSRIKKRGGIFDIFSP